MLISSNNQVKLKRVSIHVHYHIWRLLAEIYDPLRVQLFLFIILLKVVTLRIDSVVSKRMHTLISVAFELVVWISNDQTIGSCEVSERPGNYVVWELNLEFLNIFWNEKKSSIYRLNTNGHVSLSKESNCHIERISIKFMSMNILDL